MAKEDEELWGGLRIARQLDEWVHDGAPMPIPGSCAFCGKPVDQSEDGAMVLSFKQRDALMFLGTHLACVRSAVHPGLEITFDSDDGGDAEDLPS